MVLVYARVGGHIYLDTVLSDNQQVLLVLIILIYRVSLIRTIVVTSNELLEIKGLTLELRKKDKESKRNAYL